MRAIAHLEKAGILLVLLSSPLFGQGLVVPQHTGGRGLELIRHAVHAEIFESIAVVNVDHEFYNNSAATVEGDFYFPLPREAQVSKFSMIVDGKTIAGEMLPQNEARRIYEDIVRRCMDPALLEMADSRWFRARLFPVPPKARRAITLRFDAALVRNGNTVVFDYPLHGQLSSHGSLPRPVATEEALRPESHAATVSTEISLDLRSTTAITTVYSPTHPIEVQRRDNHHASVVCRIPVAEQSRTGGKSTFQLYYSLTADAVGMTLLTYRPRTDEPGYFLLLASPSFETARSEVTSSAVVFVLDCSGSMAGEKIEQARNALRYCLQRLGTDDRFGIIDFSTQARLFAPQLVQGADAVQSALAHVRQLEASGGTNINEALLAALDLLRGSEHPTIIFLTDGLPTSGLTDEGEIRGNVRRVARRNLRLYAFGVGYDVNTRLLDGLAKENSAFADYIAPQENIEERVVRFYEKTHHPAMTDVACSIEGARVTSLHPAKLPDIFRNDQLTLFGRYTNAGNANILLSGRVGREQRQFKLAAELPQQATDHDFVARLWATRRVGDLLEEIRLHGENEELKKEIEALATQYGIVTPYTSFLVREDAADYFAGQWPVMPMPEYRAKAPEHAASGAAMRAFSGEAAVNFSQSVSRLKKAEVIEAEPSGIRVIKGATLRLRADGTWLDVNYKEGGKMIKLAFASPAYFAFIKLYPEAKAFCQLGQKVLFNFRGVNVQIAQDGTQQLSETELRRVFGS